MTRIKIHLYICMLLWLCFPLGLLAQQTDDEAPSGGISFKSMRTKKKKDSITFTAKDYKLISHLRDTTSVDTTLTIQTYYKSNAWGEDLFGKMPFSNMGQPYNTMVYDFANRSYLPSMGATAKNQFYLTPEQIHYYLLPTPLTQFTYKTGMEQGQMLNTLFSVNLNPRLNLFIAYKGLRSLGNYQRILVSNGNLRLGFSYMSPNKKYVVFAHYAGNDTESQENGGITSPEQFESGDDQFKNRAVMDVFLSDADNLRESKRYFVQQDYAFLRNRDSLASYKQIRFRHRFLYETEYYKFSQNSPNAFFGDAYVTTNIADYMQLQKMVNTAGAELELPYLGRTFVYGNAYFYNYFFRNAFYRAGVLQPHQIKATELSLALQWHKKIGGFSIDAQGEQTFVGSITGTKLNGKLAYVFNEKNHIQAGIDIHSAMPNFNFLLYQSDYKNYNWNNISEFNKQHTQTLYGNLTTRWGSVSASLTNLINYTYFAVQPPATADGRGQSLPRQHSGTIQYLKLKLQKEFAFGKFRLDNTLQYQSVAQNEQVLNVPTFITRNALYLATPMFNKAMYLETGIGFNYFTRYYSNRYNPLLAEFESQNEVKTGGFPMFDFFLNAKVRTMRIYLGIEHFNPYVMDINWLFNKQYYNYYSAPNQPYRDILIRLGISWHLFS
ncbi:putative porin [Capnocytophaga sp.]|uniref:putative porin n=1 Tax=Capnocytophaga sp. TaxID=44737 RepID=UPI0026DCDFDB|nr:putative porin [Capnocytophaga sp.]MDO5105110.1 putative porin [Capnocytophaga sp.]